jgi:clan AA aspartic protease
LNQNQVATFSAIPGRTLWLQRAKLCPNASSSWLASVIQQQTRSVDEASTIGWVDANGEAIVPIALAAGVTINFVIDTGFDGELLLPASVAETLLLPIIGERECLVVGGAILTNFTSLVEIDWMGSPRVTEVILSEGDDYLVGTSLLRQTRLKIDYIARSVVIESP